MNVRRVLVVLLVAVMVMLSLNISTASAAPGPQMPAPGQFYVVRPGDTLYAIAGWHHTNVWALAQANGLINPSRIYVGQVLFIPGMAPTPPFGPSPVGPVGPFGPAVHLVRYGETLYGIARLYGISAWSIAYANGLANPNYIFAGQRLIIPMPSLPAPSPVFHPQPWGGAPGYASQYPSQGGMPYGMPVVY
jgi:LysM repeat protein